MTLDLSRHWKFVIVAVSFLFLAFNAEAQRIRPDREIEVAPDSMPDYILLSDSTNGFLQFRRIALDWSFKTDSVCLTIVEDSIGFPSESLRKCFFTTAGDTKICGLEYVGDTLTAYVCSGATQIDSFKTEIVGGGGADTDVDSLAIIGNVLHVYEDNKDRTVDLSQFVDTDIDSVKIIGNVLHIYEDAQDISVDLSQFVDTDEQQIDNFSINGRVISLEIENDGQPPQTVTIPNDSIDAYNGLTLVGSDSVKLGGFLVENTEITGSDGNSFHRMTWDSISLYYINVLSNYRLQHLGDNHFFQITGNGDLWQNARGMNEYNTRISNGGFGGISMYVFSDSSIVPSTPLDKVIGLAIDTAFIKIQTPGVRDQSVSGGMILTLQTGNGDVEYETIGDLIADSDALKRKPWHMAFFQGDSSITDTTAWDSLVLMNDNVRWIYFNDTLNALAIGKGARADNNYNTALGAYAFPFQNDTITEAITNTQIDTVNEVITGLATYITHLADLGYSTGDNVKIRFTLVSGQMPFTDSAVYMIEGDHLFNIASASTLAPIYFEFDSVETGSYELVANQYLTHSTALGDSSIVDRNRQVALGGDRTEEIKFAQDIRFDADTNFTHRQFYQYDSSTNQLIPFWWDLENNGIVYWDNADFRTLEEHLHFDGTSDVGINGRPVPSVWRLSVYGGLAVVEDPLALGRAQIRMGDTTLTDWYWFTEASDDDYVIRSHNKTGVGENEPNFVIDSAGQFWIPFYRYTTFEKNTLTNGLDKVLLTDAAGFMWNIRLDSLASQLSVAASADSLGTPFNDGNLIIGNGTRGGQENANFFADVTNTRLGIGTNTPDETIHAKSTGNASLKIDGGPLSTSEMFWAQNGTNKWRMGTDGLLTDLYLYRQTGSATIFKMDISSLLTTWYENQEFQKDITLSGFTGGVKDQASYRGLNIDASGQVGTFDLDTLGGSLWTDAGPNTYLTSTADNVTIGSTASTGSKLFVDGSFAVGTTSSFTGESTFNSAARFNDGIKDFLGGLGASGQVLKWFTGDEVRWQNVDWSELTGIPGGFSDGVDNTGPWTDAGVYTYLTTTSDNVHIGGSTNPPSKLYVTGTFAVTSTSAFTGEATFNSAARFNDGIKDFLGGLGASGQVLKWFTGDEVRWQQVLWSDLGSIPAGFADNVDNVGMTSFFWDADGTAATEITDGETISITGGTDITTSRSGNTVTINYSGSGGADELGTVITNTNIVYGQGSDVADQDNDFQWNDGNNTLFIGASLDIDDTGGMTFPNSYNFDNASGESINFTSSQISMLVGSATQESITSTVSTINNEAFIGNAPDDQLEIQSSTTNGPSIGHELLLDATPSDNDQYIQFDDNGDIYISARNAADDDIQILADDVVIIRAGTNNIQLDANTYAWATGYFSVNGGSSLTYDLEVNGTAGKTGGGSWSSLSDQRVKRDITTIEDPYTVLRSLRPVNFRYKDSLINASGMEDRIYHGYIAQEYQSVFPHEVMASKSTGMLTMSVDGAQTYTTAAVQQLIKDKEVLEAIVAKQEDRLLALENALLNQVKPAGLSVPVIDKDGIKITIDIEKK